MRYFLLLAAIFSLFIQPTAQLWVDLDVWVFLKLNHFLLSNPSSASFWAWMNSRYADWLSQALIWIIFILAFIGQKRSFKDMCLVFLKLALFVFLVQLTINKGLFLKILHLERLSPSMNSVGWINLEKVWPLWNNHVQSTFSFPADHATTLFVVACVLFKELGGKWGCVIWGLAILFSLPRVVAGAHGFSDLLIGGIGIAWFAYQFWPQRQRELLQST